MPSQNANMVVQSQPSVLLLALPGPVRRVNPYSHSIEIDFEHPYYIMDDLLMQYYSSYLDSSSTQKDLVRPRNFNNYLSDIHNDSSVVLTDKQKELIAYILYYRANYTKPPVKFDESVYFNPTENGIDKIINSYYRQNPFNPLPEAFRFYATPIGDTVFYGGCNIKFKLNTPLKDIVSPFYFKKATITNKEYREFVDWVRDSMLHLMLVDLDANHVFWKDKNGKDLDPPPINWKEKIDLSGKDAQEAVADLYLPETNKFYSRKEIDTRKLNYMYYTPHIRTISDSIKHRTYFSDNKYVINIYPDTLVWVNDFLWSFLEPYANMYFWHPAYDDYPVVGISREQAIAYLHWKTIQEQQKLDKDGKGEWEVSYELPTEYEWEMVETADRKNEQPYIYPDYFYTISDYSYITDLNLDYYSSFMSASFDDKRKIEFRDTWDKDSSVNLKLRRLIYPVIHTDNFQFLYEPGDKRHGGTEPIFTVKSDFTQNDKYIKENPFINSNYDCNGISFMGGNVSEWMQESFGHNWEKVYNYQHSFLEHLNGKDAKLELNFEDYFVNRNDTKGYVFDKDSSIAFLIRGANWYDRRTGDVAGKNISGMEAKLFISPDSSYATLGFRYVIKIHRRDEQKAIDSLKAIIKPSLFKQEPQEELELKN